jgi:hypothetical protein
MLNVSVMCFVVIHSAGSVLMMWYPKGFWSTTVAMTNMSLKAMNQITTCPAEIKVFLMMLLYISACGHTGTYTDYFNTTPDALGGMHADFTKFGITEQRAMILRNNIAFIGHDFSGSPADPFHPIRGLVDSMNEHFQKVWEPGVYLVVDESMLYWLGRGMPGWSWITRKPLPGIQFVYV